MFTSHEEDRGLCLGRDRHKSSKQVVTVLRALEDDLKKRMPLVAVDVDKNPLIRNDYGRKS